MKADQQLEGLFNDVRGYSPLSREDEFRLAWALKEQRDHILFYLSRFPQFLEHLVELREQLAQKSVILQELFHLKMSPCDSSNTSASSTRERDIVLQLGRFLTIAKKARSEGDGGFLKLQLSFQDRISAGMSGEGEAEESGRPFTDPLFESLSSLSFTQEYLNNYVDNLYEPDVLRWIDAHLVGEERDVACTMFRHLKQSRATYEEAATILVLSNLRLVVRIAKRFAGSRLQISDIVQEGMLGLMKAVDRFNVARGNRFSTYAMWWIRQSVHRSMLNNDRIVRLPVHLCERIRRMRHLIDDIQQQLGHELTDQEIHDHLALDSDEIFVWMNMMQSPRVIEFSVDEVDDSHQPLQIVADDRTGDPLQHLTSERLREEISSMLETLTSREQRVIQLRYGIAADRRYTLEEVGLQLGVTRERIRQIESRAINKLRHPLRASRLESFLT